MKTNKYAFLSLFIISALAFAVFPEPGAAAEAPVKSATDLGCPPDFNFKEAKAAQLTSCIQGMHDWIVQIAKASPGPILGIGDVEGSDYSRKWTPLSGAQLKLADYELRGKYTLAFVSGVSIDNPIVLVGAKPKDQQKMVSCGVTYTTKVEFRVNCYDTAGLAEADFWYVVLTP